MQRDPAWLGGAAASSGRAPIHWLWEGQTERFTVTFEVRPHVSDEVLQGALRRGVKAAKRRLFLRGRLKVSVDLGQRGSAVLLLARLGVTVVSSNPAPRARRVAQALADEVVRCLTPGAAVTTVLEATRSAKTRSKNGS